mmetsp:Transcript_14532/g.29086  ORF Transcript_14532/g.29086 Transcript_14532/m.29086 type:complete len:175 (+) Transcript_14532:384-908(+)
MSIDGGKPKGESGAMLRYVATLVPEKGLNPPETLYNVEDIMGLVGDLKQSFYPCIYIAMRPQNLGYPEDYGKTEEGAAHIATMRKAFVADQLPTFLGHFESALDAHGGKWVASEDAPTIADCAAVAVLRSFTKGHIDHVDVGCLEISPKVVDYVERFCALPEIKGRYNNGLGKV